MTAPSVAASPASAPSAASPVAASEATASLTASTGNRVGGREPLRTEKGLAYRLLVGTLGVGRFWIGAPTYVARSSNGLNFHIVLADAGKTSQSKVRSRDRLSERMLSMSE